MSDEPFTSPGRKIQPRQPVPGERLFEFLIGDAHCVCELRDDGKYGTDVQFFKGGDLERDAIRKDGA